MQPVEGGEAAIGEAPSERKRHVGGNVEAVGVELEERAKEKDGHEREAQRGGQGREAIGESRPLHAEEDEDIDIRAVGDEVRQGAGEPGCPTHDKQREGEEREPRENEQPHAKRFRTCFDPHAPCVLVSSLTHMRGPTEALQLELPRLSRLLGLNRPSRLVLRSRYRSAQLPQFCNSRSLLRPPRGIHTQWRLTNAHSQSVGSRPGDRRIDHRRPAVGILRSVDRGLLP